MNKKVIEMLVKNAREQIRFYEKKLNDEKYNLNYRMLIEYYKGAHDMALHILQNK